MGTLRVGLLVGSGSRIPALRSFELNHGGFTTACVVTCKRTEPPLVAWLREQGVPASVLHWPTLKRPVEQGGHGLTQAACNTRLADLLASHGVDLVVGAGWMPMMGSELLDRFPGRVIGVHPGLIPDSGLGEWVRLDDGQQVAACRGADGVAVALERQAPVAGCSIFFVTAEYDAGPVIWRATVAVQPDDTHDSLGARIHAWEDVGLAQVITQFAQGKVRRLDGGPVPGERSPILSAPEQAMG